MRSPKDPSGAFSAALRLFRNRKQAPSIKRVDPDRPHSLSYAQEDLWLFQHIHPDSPVYNLVHPFRIQGRLNIQALEQAINEIVRRHTILRTTYHLEADQPIQRVQPYHHRPLKILDLRQCSSEKQRQEQVAQYTRAEASQPFDLSRESSFRFALLQLHDNEFILIFCIHHIAYDVSSERIFFREISTLYKTFCAGVPTSLPELAIQYVDYAAWQRQTLTDDALAEKIEFYQPLIDNISPIINLPPDLPQSNEQDFACKTFIAPIDPYLHHALRRFNQQEGVSLFDTLISAFFILLHRYSGQNTFMVGSLVTNRNQAHLSQLLGIFVNEIALPVDVSDNPTFHILLQRVQHMTKSVYAHADIPFSKLFHKLELNRGDHLPASQLSNYFSVVFNMPGYLNDMQLSGLNVERQSPRSFHNLADLVLTVLQSKDGIHLHMTYQANRFSEERIAQMSTHYLTLLGTIVETPQNTRVSIGKLPILTETERHKILLELTGPVPTPSEHSIPHLFEAQVARTPDTIALVAAEDHLTYAVLNSRANQLARVFQKHGVGPEIRVGLYLPRTPDLMIGVLAILKAGGAYVPLDLDTPAERIGVILDDAHISVLITHSTLRPRLPASNDLLLIHLDTEWAQISTESTTNLPVDVSLKNLAYLIYTSGTTGKPKGVMIAHESLGQYVETAAQEFALAQHDRILQFASISFDASAEEIYPCLTRGGTLLLRPDSLLDSWPEFLATVETQQLTVLDLPTAVWHELLASMGTTGLPLPQSVRLVIIGGERARPDCLALWQERIEDGVRLVNTYGPTEATIVAIQGTLTPVSPAGSPPVDVPLGAVLPHVRGYLIDQAGYPVPSGLSGECYLGGVGVARGYMGHPAMTAEKFLPDPFSPEAGARLYRTGDLLRYRAEGAFEFVGRADHQVKLRGYRIELGEIEVALEQQPSVEQAVVLCREDIPGQKQLAAYIVPNPEALPEPATLRALLKAQLPEYMVPSAFVVLERLPLTPNGKIDRKALPAPEDSDRTQGMDYVAPRRPLEEIVAAIWQEVLGLEQVGIHDNFFEVGGHSLLATQVVSRAQRHFNNHISLKDFFAQPTVAGIAVAIASSRIPGARAPLPPLRPVDRSHPLPLSFSQQRLWLLDQLEPDSTAYSMPCTYHLTGSLDVRGLEQSLQALIARHEVLRTTFVGQDGEPRQVIAPMLPFNLPVEDLQAFPQEEQTQYCLKIRQEDRGRPFDLAQGPLIRARLCRLAPDKHLFLLNLHHIISDGLSMDILFRDLRDLYQGITAGLAPSLSPLPIQYADYAVWQRQVLQGERLESLLTYWRTQMGGLPASVSLPPDRPRPAVQTHRGANLKRNLAPYLIQQVKTFSQTEGVTVFMTLLAAFQLLLARHTGQEDTVVGTPVASRPRVELEDVVGLFLNTLVLRTEVARTLTARKLVQRVREVCLGAYAHQDLPFEKLVEELQPERDLSRTPLFQIFFNLVDVSNAQLNLPGVTLGSGTTPDPTIQEETTAKFDLTLYVTLQGDTWTLQFTYNADLFDSTTIAWLAEHYETLLEGMVSMPDVPIAMISVFGEAGRATPGQTGSLVAVPSPASFQEFPPVDLARSLPQRFEEQVAHQPQQVALQSQEETWTYEELNRQANRVAHTLLETTLYSSTPQRIALLCSPGGPMLAALLGVLKVGNTYVPLEPTLPLARLEYMLKDAAATTILATQSAQDQAEALRQQGHQVLIIEDIEPETQETNPVGRVSPDTIAYLLYTSGTTGAPKGVIQTHRNVLHHMRVYTNNLKISRDDRLTLLSSYSFDAGVMDIFGALLNGATLYIFTLQEASPEDLSHWLAQKQITIYHSTPTVFRYWLNQWPPPTTFPALRLVVLGGEEATRADFEAYKRYLGTDCLLVNGFGLTESTVNLQFLGSQGTKLLGSTIPLGYQVEDTEVVLLDEAGHLTELYGEMAIRSPYVALGYWQLPELTQQVFSESHEPDGIRQYRTGDLGSYRADGTLEFMERKDTQIKLRGYRIELGEIEMALRQQTAVRQAVVTCREDHHGGKQLVAYVVPEGPVELTSSFLRTTLGTQLPAYMVPTAFVRLETLPLTPNGKLDRKALPAPRTTDGTQGTNFVAPRNVLEDLLVTVWQEVLQIEPIGIHDNFFNLGGHSLLATQVMARIRTRLHNDLPLRTLFEQPTVAGLAEALHQAQSVQDQGASTDDLAHLLKNIDDLSEEEAQALLEKERQESTDTQTPL